MKIVNQNNAEHYQWARICDGWHLLKTPSLSVIQEKIPASCCEERHFHNQSQQFFYVLAGTATIEIDGNEFRINSGSGIHVPAQMPHQVFNNSEIDLELLVISEPLSHGDRVNVD